MYHGAVMPGRGVERLIEAVNKIDVCVGLVILGNGDNKYVERLKAIANKDRIAFMKAVPLSELWKYVGAVDVSCVPIEIVAKNHYFSLPNKFFESIQSKTPLITSEVPEMKKIVDYYGIGLTCKPGDVADLSRCILKMQSDEMFYNQCKNNLQRAKEDLCWEKEKKRLVEKILCFKDG